MPLNRVSIGPDLLRLGGTLVLGGVGVTGGVAGVLLGLFGLQWLLSSGWVIVAVTGSLVTCCAGAFYLAAAIGHRPRVEIGPEGFVVRNAFGSRSRRWGDISGDFVVIKVGVAKGVGYRLTEEYKSAARIKPTTLFAGNDEAISGAFSVPINELANLLNRHKGQARSSA